ncbi:MAG: hypothetical protein LBP95_06190 [Deltaproteobacteria bacterium]|jgi:cell division protein FtsZ|nr:hypothetical protein [Deltaproteobacteria bacterium]
MTELYGPEDDGRELHKIRVLGIGGCGNNAINHMVKMGLDGPRMIAANTDICDLDRCLAGTKIQIGVDCTEGFGCGGDPAKGRRSAEENMEDILRALDGANIVFVTAGLGGGTGTGGAPTVIEALSKVKKPPLVVSVVVTPFFFEPNRVRVAQPALEELLRVSNSLITISNGKLSEHFSDFSFKQCREMADDVLYRAVHCITDLIETSGEINLDFADISEALSARGRAIMGVGEASGPDRAAKAVDMAVNCPLMDDQSIKGAKFILVNVTADDDIRYRELEDINSCLVAQASPDVKVFSGLKYDNSLAASGTVKVTVIATGLDYGEQADAGLEDEPIPLDLEPEPQIVLAPEPSSYRSAPALADPVPAPSLVPTTAAAGQPLPVVRAVPLGVPLVQPLTVPQAGPALVQASPARNRLAPLPPVPGVRLPDPAGQVYRPVNQPLGPADLADQRTAGQQRNIRLSSPQQGSRPAPQAPGGGGFNKYATSSIADAGSVNLRGADPRQAPAKDPGQEPGPYNRRTVEDARTSPVPAFMVYRAC